VFLIISHQLLMVFYVSRAGAGHLTPQTWTHRDEEAPCSSERPYIQ